jgi:hypothetical protein
LADSVCRHGQMQVPFRSAVAAVNLQEIAALDQVADRHGLELQRPWLATAPGLVPSLSSSTR